MTSQIRTIEAAIARLQATTDAARESLRASTASPEEKLALALRVNDAVGFLEAAKKALRSQSVDSDPNGKGIGDDDFDPNNLAADDEPDDDAGRGADAGASGMGRGNVKPVGPMPAKSHPQWSHPRHARGLKKGVTQSSRMRDLTERLVQQIEKSTNAMPLLALQVLEVRERQALAAATNPEVRLRHAIALSDIGRARERLTRGRIPA